MNIFKPRMTRPSTAQAEAEDPSVTPRMTRSAFANTQQSTPRITQFGTGKPAVDVAKPKIIGVKPTVGSSNLNIGGGTPTGGQTLPTTPNTTTTTTTPVTTATSNKVMNVDNASLNASRDYSMDVMKGRDFLTQGMISGNSEQEAARSAAARGASAQQANLAGMSASAQNLIGRLGERDIEAERQAGLAKQQQVLGDRADVAASNLAGIGQFESSYNLDKSQVDQGNLEKEYNETIKNVKINTPEGLAAVNAVRAKMGWNEIGYDEAVELKNKSDRDGYLKEFYADLELTKDSFFDDNTKTYDIDAIIADDQMSKKLIRAWESESNGTNKYDPTDPNDVEALKKYTLKHVTSGMSTEADRAANELLDALTEYTTSPEFKSLPKGTQDEIIEGLSGVSALAKTGLTPTVDSNGVFTLKDMSGNVIFGTSVYDNMGSSYKKVGDNVSITSPDGTTSIATQDSNGTWTTETTVVDPKLGEQNKNAIESAVKNGKHSAGTRGSLGTYTYDSTTGDVTKSYLGKTTTFKKDASGNWVAYSKKNSKLSGSQLDYVNKVVGDKSLIDPVTNEKYVVPTGVKPNSWYSQGGKVFMNDGGTPKAVEISEIQTNDVGKLIDATSDNLSLSGNSPLRSYLDSISQTGTMQEKISALLTDSGLTPAQKAKVASSNSSILHDYGTLNNEQAFNATNTMSKGQKVTTDAGEFVIIGDMTTPTWGDGKTALSETILNKLPGVKDTFLGGSDGEYVRAVSALDKNGNVVVLKFTKKEDTAKPKLFDGKVAGTKSTSYKVEVQ